MHLIAQHDAFAGWLGHLHDAFELVDWRSGAIRDPATAAWLLEETLTALAQIDQPRVQDFVKTFSLVECINGLLKSFLNNRQGFRNRETLQAYLDLCVGIFPSTLLLLRANPSASGSIYCA